MLKEGDAKGHWAGWLGSALGRWKRRRAVMGVLVMPAALLMALAVGAFFIVLAGANPIEAYRGMAIAAFGSRFGLSETLVKAIPLALVALGTTVAYRCQVYNIGQEGQLMVGAIVTTGVALAIGDRLGWLLLPVLMAVALIAGALWGVIPGLLKVRLNVNEVISSLMLNYIALLVGSYFVHHPWREKGGFIPQTPMISEFARLPVLVPKTRLHAGLVLVVIAAGLLYVLLNKTTTGYRIRAVGANPKAAETAGINVAKTIILVTLVGGALAGLAGMGEISAIHYRLKDGITMNYGFTGIVVALLGRLNPVGAVVAAALFGALLVGADAMQYAAGVPVFLAYVIQGLVVLFVLGSEALLRRQ